MMLLGVAVAVAVAVTSCVKLYSGLTKMSKALGTRKTFSNPSPVGKRTCRITRKIGNIRKKNRQPISELLERKIDNFRSRLGSCLVLTPS